MPKFNAQKIIHSRRHLLDAILLKLSSGIWWAKVPTQGFSINDLSWTFRRWKTEGLFDQVLEVLRVERRDGPQVQSITRVGNKPVMVSESLGQVSTR